MDLNALHHYMLWYEREDGTPLPANLTDPHDMPPVDVYPYAVARFPLVIETTHYKRRASDGMYGAGDVIARAHSSAREDLVVALVNGGAEGSRLKRWMRGTPSPPKIPLSQAIIIASEACGRCANALAHKYGLPWGCPEGGVQWCGIHTECAMCRGRWIPIG